MVLFPSHRAFLAALALAASLPALAATPAPPSWFHYSWDIPIQRGLYIAENSQGTLGTLTIGFTEDSRAILGGAVLFYDANGNPVNHGTDGHITFNDDDTLRDTGIVGTTELTEYSLTNGACRDCPWHANALTPSGEVGRFDWTGPRSGVYTLNGVENTMVEAFSGPPLVNPTDLSGTWLLVYRLDLYAYEATPPATSHEEFVAVVNVTPVTTPRTYGTVIATPGSAPPFGSVALPPDGSRQYDVTCQSGTPYCDLASPTYDGVSTRFTLWVDNHNTGRFMGVRVTGSGSSATYTVADTGRELARVYATDREIVGRHANSPESPSYLIDEFHMTRLADDTLTGAYAQ